MAQEEYVQNQNMSGNEADEALANINEKLFGEVKPQRRKVKIRTIMGLVVIVFSLAAILASGSFTSSLEIKQINIATPNPDDNDKLVYASGKLTTSDFTDPMFSVTANGVYLQRVVEMYQWVESNNTFVKEWKSEIVDLSSENAREKGLSNPAEMPFFSEKWHVDAVKMGNFTLSDNMVKSIDVASDISLTNEDFSKLNEYGQKAFKLHDGKYFFGLDPQNPRIGDIKVSFRALNPESVTVLAKQSGSSFAAYKTDNGIIEKIVIGGKSIEEMKTGFDLKGSSLNTWLIRIIALITAILGGIIIIGRKNGKHFEANTTFQENAPEIKSLSDIENEENHAHHEEDAEMHDDFAVDEHHDGFIEDEERAEYTAYRASPAPHEEGQQFYSAAPQPHFEREPAPVPAPNPYERKLSSPLDFNSEPSFAEDATSFAPAPAEDYHISSEEDDIMPEGIEFISDEQFASEEGEYKAEYDGKKGKTINTLEYNTQPDEVSDNADEEDIGEIGYAADIPQAVEIISEDDFIEQEDSVPEDKSIPYEAANAEVVIKTEVTINELPHDENNINDDSHYYDPAPFLPDDVTDEESGSSSAENTEDEKVPAEDVVEARKMILPPPPPPLMKKIPASDIEGDFAAASENIQIKEDEYPTQAPVVASSFELPNIPDDFDPTAEMKEPEDNHDEIEDNNGLPDLGDPFSDSNEEIEFNPDVVEHFDIHDENDLHHFEEEDNKK